jgi:hypothetical protein
MRWAEQLETEGFCKGIAETRGIVSNDQMSRFISGLIL